MKKFFSFNHSLSKLFCALSVFLLASLISSRAHADGETATSEIKYAVDEIIKINEQFAGEAKAKERRAKLRDLINPRFDFEEMSKRSLGSNWSSINPDQQKEFVALFSDLLSKTYLNRIETVKAGMVKFDGEESSGGSEAAAETAGTTQKAVVKTLVENNGSNFPIHYKSMLKGGKWKVYDVVIENIGLVANYRSEFAGIMRKEQFEGLMKRLKEKMNAA